MVSSFLSSVAQLLRKLIASGRAIHCTEADAAELEMLAGLFEQHGPPSRVVPQPDSEQIVLPARTLQRGSVVKIGGGEATTSVTPTDIAFGWLKLSSWDIEPLFSVGEINYDDIRLAIKRAAVCAELVAITMSRRGCTGCVPDFDVTTADVSAHDGTIEGARAAWEFIVEVFEKNSHGMFHPLANIDGQPIALGVMERFRRELEAMR